MKDKIHLLHIQKGSIKWKLFGYFLGFCFLLLVILWTFQTVFLDSFYKSIKAGEVKKEAAALSVYVRQEDWAGLKNAAGHGSQLTIEIWDDTYQIAATTSGMPQDAEIPMLPEEKMALFAEVRENGTILTQRFETNDRRGPRRMDGILYAMVTQADSGAEYLMLVSANISPVSATVQTLRIQLFYISGIMLILAASLSIFISKRIAGPIENLRNTARQMGAGNYEVTFEGTGYQEIADLADTLTGVSKELSKTESLRRELIANVSHDLRTPLTLIAGYAEMMRDMPEEIGPENMQVIIDESRRLTSLVGDLLNLSQLQSGVHAVHIRPFDFTVHIADIVDRFSSLCEGEGYAVTFTYAEEAKVCGDAERIAQVVYNFLVNAMNHTGADKKICVVQKIQNGMVRLEVRDTGAGIAPEDIANIWNRYYKVDKVHKRAISGSGLGLSIVKNILDQHPGVHYGVESCPGEGSTFWFAIDRMQE